MFSTILHCVCTSFTMYSTLQCYFLCVVYVCCAQFPRCTAWCFGRSGLQPTARLWRLHREPLQQPAIELPLMLCCVSSCCRLVASTLLTTISMATLKNVLGKIDCALLLQQNVYSIFVASSCYTPLVVSS